ncbi:hypothetical protein Lesp02_44870 [Lentzea sp. NBRC 105346]|uniref:hypothetical protein n=1 Tax=Lentzea sp. NBRC 105346 TaxID=3032205 RepID=UPI0024A242CB|nr:hypothetical protein [Lentzea sp. NBRC 105346]GLZ32299.1 hypothetical protein Lesp02_44870 [Lentzea sp. NBRC 105346]
MRRILLTVLAVVASMLPATTAHADDPPRYRTYYSIFTRGQQQIPYLDTTPYVPQGLTHWPELDAMVVSYYHDGGGNARLTVLDRTTSRRIKTLTLDDTGHAGALATSRNFIWVATGGKVVRYAKSALAGAADGATVTRNRAYSVLAASFMEISGDKMYVGAFDPDNSATAYRYSLDAAEEAHYDNHSFGVPSKVQGMAITSAHFIWSRSWGRDNDSQIVVDPRNGAISRTVTAPNMSEDLATVGGQLYVVYESGAKKYADADYKVRTIHHGPLSELIP